VIRHADHVIRHHRNFTTAAGSIYHIGRNRVARRVAAQPFDDLHALGNRCAKVSSAFHQVALIQVIRAHPNPHQVLHQPSLNMHAVVHARQQHALIAQRNARPSQAVSCLCQFSGDFIGVVDMDIHPQGMVFLQSVAQFRRHPLRHKHRNAAANPDNLNVRNFAQPAQQFLKNFRRQRQRIAAREQHITHLRRILQILNLGLKFCPREGRAWVAHDPRASAVPAVRSALSCHQHQHPVWVAVHQPGNRRVAIFGQGIFHHSRKRQNLVIAGDNLQPDGVIRIVRVN